MPTGLQNGEGRASEEAIDTCTRLDPLGYEAAGCPVPKGVVRHNEQVAHVGIKCRNRNCTGDVAMKDPAIIARWEVLCAAAVALFSCSGALIMQIPRGERRTLFIFPIFLSVVIGGSLTVFGIENFSTWTFVGAALIPIALVQVVRLVAPGWLMTALSYMTMIAAVICADLLLEASAFR